MGIHDFGRIILIVDISIGNEQEFPCDSWTTSPKAKDQGGTTHTIGGLQRRGLI